MNVNFIEYIFYFLCIKIEFQKIANFLDKTSDDKDLPTFAAKKWIEVYDQSKKKNYKPNKEIRRNLYSTRKKTTNIDDLRLF